MLYWNMNSRIRRGLCWDTSLTSDLSTIGGGRGCNKIVPVLGGDGTRIAPPGDLFDQPPRAMS